MNRVILKGPDAIAKMRRAGQLLAQVFTELDHRMLPGVTTMAINQWVEHYIRHELAARPASLGQYDYPYSLNASPNHVVCHGFPTETPMQEGDIVNIDITLEKDGYIADSSKTYCIGQVSSGAQKLVDATYTAMWQGIKAVKPGNTLGDIGHAIDTYARQQGYSVVLDYCGHGIGQQMHEAPQVLHSGRAGTGLTLKPGMTFTIEPMINQGRSATRTLRDQWTVITQDKQLSAQWEHTVLVTPTGVEVLTLRPEEAQRNSALG
ncbi:type I methionyl aminopeptidase [Gilvimarinus agarilyticus]|uniref:type I methionyl aminopeptidase n=1 Tax=unclassified Gilvimarinus TaxID=2642066 RepID=UPI001C0A56AE|nr:MULTISPECIES: type I methionyl aminopeptidase [unclassified Gilvimarinus]MBU2884978.1 type I methionyl aminopeptidase [Gilvimarinus agarilyticus]MDO6569875.1 type I methionyl aminopeptidase [Gilvimarinus sp. 2_MG-2023]MDO6747088.1 type I methionyl aminopeptidase [Gilvimarinus sp. 1_MG-2023]